MRTFGSAKIAAFVLFGVLAVSALGTRFTGTSEQPESSPGTSDSLDWVRKEIVGTWSQESSQQGWRWVFTSDNTLRKYHDGTLVTTVSYSVVKQCKDFEIDTQSKYGNLAMLELTESSSDLVTCQYVANMKKTDDGGPADPPFLLIGTRQGTISFGKYSSTQRGVNSSKNGSAKSIDFLSQMTRSLKPVAFALFGVPAVSALGTRFIGVSDQPDSSPGTSDSLDWVRQEIDGTWEESDQNRKWVFTTDGTLRKYQEGSLAATKDYAIVSGCKDYKITPGKFEPMAILKETSSDGRVVCNSVKNMKKSGDGGAPFLLVGTRYGVYNFDMHSSVQ